MVSWPVPPVLSLLLFTLVGAPYQQTPTPACASISFDYFQAAVYNSTIELDWQTSCEAYQPSYHHLRRAPDLNGPWTEVDIFASRGVNGGFYSHRDVGLSPGAYYYRIDIKDPNGVILVPNIQPDPGYDPVGLGTWTPAPPQPTSTSTSVASPSATMLPSIIPTPAATDTPATATETPTAGPSATMASSPTAGPAQPTATRPPAIPPTRPFSGPTATPRLAPSPVASATRTSRPTLPPPPPPTARRTASAPTPALPTAVSPSGAPAIATRAPVARVITPVTPAETAAAPSRSLGWALLGAALIGIVGIAVLGFLVFRSGRTPS